jgi:uncharacterized protein YggT (Ycf19 family)
MSLIDFILNVAGILLSLNWRSATSDPFLRGTPATLAGTVRRAQPVRVKRWHYLAIVLGLLFLRALFYRYVGPAVNWTAKLDFYFVVLTFQEAHFLSALTFSVVSFLRAFMVCYFWLITLAAINRNSGSSDPLQKMISLQIGRISRWPGFVQVIGTILVVAVLWLALHPLLVYVDATNRVRSYWSLSGQGLLVGIALLISLKYLLPVILALYLTSSYVYFGKSPLWDFLSLTARNLLAGMRISWMRMGKVDLAPVVAIILILLLLHGMPNLTLVLLDRFGRTVWPQ